MQRVYRLSPQKKRTRLYGFYTLPIDLWLSIAVVHSSYEMEAATWVKKKPGIDIDINV